MLAMHKSIYMGKMDSQRRHWTHKGDIGLTEQTLLDSQRRHYWTHRADTTGLTEETLLGNCTNWSRVDESEQSSRRRPLGLSRDPASAPPPRPVRREGEVREEDWKGEREKSLG